MVFSGLPFLFYFLPATLLLYFLVPRRGKNAVLLLASFVFYAWGAPKFLPLLAAYILVGYCFGLLLEKHRSSGWLLTLAVALCLAPLAYFKYANFFLDNARAITGLPLPVLKIALPTGISFYTFQIISYLIDCKRGDVPAQRNLISFATYAALFPQLIAGPIVRYSDVAAQMDERQHSMEKAALGARRFVIGLAKKVLLANLLGELCTAFAGSAAHSVLYCWVYAIAFTLQIYFDFSGYSDMAIGLGRIFGFDFPENFHYPYISGSITEFWRRWHMTLGGWFRDYVYIPLGGNRVSMPKWFRNLFVVWLLTGFWHGASWNFICWGLLFGVLLAIEKAGLLKLLRRARVLNHVSTLFFVVLGFVLFNANTLPDALAQIGGLFGAGGLPAVTVESLYALRSYAGVLLIAAVGATPLPKLLIARICTHRAGGAAIRTLEPIVLAALLLVVTAFLVDGSFNPFLYFRF